MCAVTKKRFSIEQIAASCSEPNAGAYRRPVPQGRNLRTKLLLMEEAPRGLEPTEVGELKHLRDENTTLTRLAPICR